MYWENNWYLRFIVFVTTVAADLCPIPEIRNGQILINGVKEDDYLYGEVACNPGFHMVGFSKNLKCRKGIWSQRVMPMCGVNTCPKLSHLHHGRNIKVRNSGGSAYHFRCNNGYKRYGVKNTHCDGHNWSHGDNMPICTRNTCDQTGMLDIPYGQGKALMHGAVYKYRCNPGTEMEGRDTVACTGRFWNGSMPTCNVEPSPPKLELLVAGSSVEDVKVGDWVVVSCQARGGNPIPDIDLKMDDDSFSAKDTMQFKNTFTFQATEDMNGKTVQCSASNKMGDSEAEKTLTILSPPTKLEVHGPDTIHHNNHYIYTCSAMDGFPAPAIKWMVNGEEMEGEDLGNGHSELSLVTDDKVEAGMKITCQAENSEGVLGESIHVNMEFLPRSIQILAPTSITEGDTAHVECILAESNPVPDIIWTLEKFGDEEETIEEVADYAKATTEDGSVKITKNMKHDMDEEEDITHIVVSCSAGVEGLGKVSSDKMKIVIDKIETTTTEEPVTETDIQEDLFEDFKLASHLYQKENETDEYDYEGYEDYNEDGSVKKDTDKTKSANTDNEYDEKDAVNNGVSKENQLSSSSKVKYELEESNFIKLSSSDDDNIKIAATDRKQDNRDEKILWIPYEPNQDIEEYQENFNPRFYYNEDEDDADAVTNQDDDEEFLKAADLPEPRVSNQGDQSSSVLVSKPTPMLLASGATPTITIGNIVTYIMVTIFFLRNA